MPQPSDREIEVFNVALELPPAERAAYLDQACADDAALRQRIEELLQSSGESCACLEAPAVDSAGSGETVRLALNPTEKPGDRIGRYKLLQQIGEGGCGVVYLAEQEEPVHRRVALKVIKLGMDTKNVIARFEAERQALALMDHPNIARVLDAGATDTGRPYFVMELVRGIKITDYCDQNNLSTRERLDLFIQVCRAIQHAHQKGIIHRDIKPSNILVTMDDRAPVPKVIDFGIAKATTDQRLTDKTLFTAFEQFIGTPAYMSPEQAEMSELGIDTRSDIYSLGVLLYELLTGQTPFEAKELLQAGLDAMRRIIREQEPARPSTRLSTLLEGKLTIVASHRQTEPSKLVHLLRGDLDWIVIKSLEKDRVRRYETANGLAADIQRHLNNEPVSARPPSNLYRFQKAWRRNKLAFTAAAVIAASLVLGTTVSTWQAIQASRASTAEKEQRLAAQTERDKAQTAQKEAERSQQAEKQERLQAEQREAEKGHLLYIANMNLAQQAWDQNDIGWLRQLLEETRAFPDRGFEWYYWQGQTDLSLMTLRGHLVGLNTVAFSPDGQRIVTSSGDRTARLWDATSGKELVTLNDENAADYGTHDSGITCVAFSPDGQRIVTGNLSGDPSVGLNKPFYPVPPPPLGTASVWDPVSGRKLLTINAHKDRVVSVAFSPDGQRILTGSRDHTAKVWDAANGHLLLALKGHDNVITSVAFSPDGQRILTGGWDCTAKAWDAVSGQELFTLKGHTSSISSVAFSPDGRRILTGSADETAKLWDTASGQELLTLKGHTSAINSVCFSPDGSRILTGSADCTAKVWDTASGRELITLAGHTGPIFSAAFSPNGKWIVTGSDDRTAKVWDATGGKGQVTLDGLNNAIFFAVFSRDGRRILTCRKFRSAKVWDAISGRELLTLTWQTNVISSAAFSPDGRWIVTGSDSGGSTAKLWDTASRRELLTLNDPNNGWDEWITSVAFSPDGQRIATGSCGSDSTVKLWDATSGRKLLTLFRQNGGRILSLVFSPDGRRIASGFGDSAMVWDTASGEELLTLDGHNGEVSSVAFSPDGQKIVTGNDDRTAKVWDAASGRELLTLKGYQEKIRFVAFSPEGKRILTGSAEGNAKVWEAASGRELLTLKGHNGGILSAAFSPDGERIFTMSSDGTVKVWEAPRTEQVLAVQRSVPGLASPSVAEILISDAGVLQALGKPNEAENEAREDRDITRKLTGPDLARLPSLISQLGQLLKTMGKFDESKKLFGDNINAAREKLGETNLILGELSYDFGEFLSHEGELRPSAGQYLNSLPKKVEEATKQYREAAHIILQLRAEEAVTLPAVVRGYAELLRAQGKFQEAEKLYDDTIALARKNWGESGPVLGGLLYGSGFFLQHREGKPAAAVEQYLKALTIRYANTNDELSTTLRELVNALLSSGKPKDAEHYLREALTIFRSLHAVDDTYRTAQEPNFLDTLAAACSENGQFTNAVRVQQEAIALLRTEEQKKDFTTRLKLYESNTRFRDPDPLAERASALLDEGQFAEAEPVARECLALREKMIPDSWRTFNARSMLGGSLLGQKNYAEAEPLLLAGYQGMNQRESSIPPEGKPRLSESLQRLVQLFDATQRPEQAAEWRKKLAKLEMDKK